MVFHLFCCFGFFGLWLLNLLPQEERGTQKPRNCCLKRYCRSHSKCPCGAPGAPGFLGAVFFCSCLIKGESRVHNLAICSFFWGSVVVWVLMGGEGGEKDVDCPIGW